MYAVSEARSRTGFAGAITGKPRRSRFVISWFQPEESAQPPCTNTMVGLGLCSPWPSDAAAAAVTLSPSPSVRIAASVAAIPRPNVMLLRILRNIGLLLLNATVGLAARSLLDERGDSSGL